MLFQLLQVTEIANIKMVDLNCQGDVERAVKIISGTARNMGIEVKAWCALCPRLHPPFCVKAWPGGLKERCTF